MFNYNIAPYKTILQNKSLKLGIKNILIKICEDSTYR